MIKTQRVGDSPKRIRILVFRCHDHIYWIADPNIDIEIKFIESLENAKPDVAADYRDLWQKAVDEMYEGIFEG